MSEITERNQSKMYECCMCKRHFSGVPAMQNGIGCFCPECREIKRIKTKQGHRPRRVSDKCNWCGSPMSPYRQHHGAVCPACERNRDWLLRCVRHSDYPLKYVLRTREKRVVKEKEEAIKPIAQAERMSIESISRTLAKICDELGIQP